MPRLTLKCFLGFVILAVTGFAQVPDFTETKKKAEAGDDAAQFDLGNIFFVGEGVPKDTVEAAKWYRKAAEQGNASAQFNLGLLYYIGHGVPQDAAEAAKLYRKAAEQGVANAQYYLGALYTTGEGVPKDDVEAVKWYRKAAEQGNAAAQGNLGSMYSNGEGVPKDTIEGLAWTNIAAASGNELFVKNRGIIEGRLGTEATLAAQQRSKQILKEIEAKKRAPSSATPKESNTNILRSAETPKASGSGAIVSTQGHIVTAAHVVAGASSVKVLTSQGMRSAKILPLTKPTTLLC